METTQAFRIAVTLINRRQPFTVLLKDGTRIPCDLMVSTDTTLTGGGGVIEVITGQHREVIDVSDIHDITLDKPEAE